MSRSHFLAEQILLELSGASLKYFVSIHSFNMQGTSLLCNPKSVPMSNSPVHYGPFVRDINRVHMIPKPVKKIRSNTASRPPSQRAVAMAHRNVREIRS